jgi:hypothetical protein
MYDHVPLLGTCCALGVFRAVSFVKIQPGGEDMECPVRDVTQF